MLALFLVQLICMVLQLVYWCIGQRISFAGTLLDCSVVACCV
jgi:hypothetical protein